ncbi:phage virion morphogenesis protein [Enterobacter hormaechei]|uniref:phage virion morphogenesis protein n=1 Tax=Enterobacter hormaechei TaxID=158836 RepID=UPI003C2CB752
MEIGYPENFIDVQIAVVTLRGVGVGPEEYQLCAVGSPYQARKRQPLRAKTGRIKRTMFQKLRTSRYMKASGRENSAVVEFTGKVQRIARIHQYGLKDRPNAHAQDVQYAERQLLGFSREDSMLIESLIVSTLTLGKKHF